MKKKAKNSSPNKTTYPEGERSWPEKNNRGTTKDNRTYK